VNRSAAILLAAALSATPGLFAQSLESLITESHNAYNSVKNNLLKAADKMPEDAYSFRPTPELQTFGQRIAHVAGQIGQCSGLTGERKMTDANSKTAKADLVAALKASFDACDAAWESMNEKTAMEMVAGRGGSQRTKLAVLIGNTLHIDEVYGTMTVYMRLKGMVPPSSEGRGGMRK
jgi:hypothetical protein